MMKMILFISLMLVTSRLPPCYKQKHLLVLMPRCSLMTMVRLMYSGGVRHVAKLDRDMVTVDSDARGILGLGHGCVFNIKGTDDCYFAFW